MVRESTPLRVGRRHYRPTSVGGILDLGWEARLAATRDAKEDKDTDADGDIPSWVDRVVV